MSMFRPGAPASSPAHPPDAVSNAEPAAHAVLLDDPQEWSAFGRPVGPTGQAAEDPASCAWDSQVVLDGMHCAACALTIEDALRRVPGVLQADVSAATRRARVVWQPSQVQPSQWMDAVHKAGYRAMPALEGEVLTVPVRVTIPKSELKTRKSEIRFRVRARENPDLVAINTTTFIGP